MAHLPTFPDPSQRRSSHSQTRPSTTGDPEFSFTELTRLLRQHGAGSSSEDLALDLLLHEVVTQACSATGAAGAAIALLRDGEFVCRAATGKHTPDLGSQLASNSGLSGACIRSHEVQRCDDTEIDARVDAAACRRLGVRSVVVVPLLKGSEVAGVLETFSPRSEAFTDSDIQVLTVLSRRIMDTAIAPPEKQQETVSSSTLFNSDTMPRPGKDHWTPVLMVLVVALALLLGWMLGHRSSSEATKVGETPSAPLTSAKSVPPADETSSQTPSVPVANATPAAEIPKGPATTPGGLLVYESGKLVFQVKPELDRAHSIAVQVPPSAANSFLIERVEPQYPEQARLAHIQGPVILQVEVDEKGTVSELRALSGDSQLVMAAADAVRQWRFKTYAPRGQALNFETQVTVDFKLP